VKLLFDQNLSPRLVTVLRDLYPDSRHTFLLGLDRASDEVIWAYAATNGYTIVTKDADFNEMCLVRGFPPKVILLQMGNCTTRQIQVVLQAHVQTLLAWSTDPVNGVLKLL
jgi:predicted nuclease of predicted toxin-antitoxin system